MTEKDRKTTVSAYQELSGILNSLKTEKISMNDALSKIQLKETLPTRPYCKVTSSGALALYGIQKQPIVMYADQWKKLLKVCKSNYVENYMSYNTNRLKFKNKGGKKIEDEGDASKSLFSVTEIDELEVV
jgi:hypothetical protein